MFLNNLLYVREVFPHNSPAYCHHPSFSSCLRLFFSQEVWNWKSKNNQFLINFYQWIEKLSGLYCFWTTDYQRSIKHKHSKLCDASDPRTLNNSNRLIWSSCRVLHQATHLLNSSTLTRSKESSRNLPAGSGNFLRVICRNCRLGLPAESFCICRWIYLRNDLPATPIAEKFTFAIFTVY